jgi:pimeloyl-ACP methyl ester carboxylesterase
MKGGKSMIAGGALPLEERLLRLFRQLGIERAHIAARNVADWQNFATAYPERIASLSLVCPRALDMRRFTGLATRTLVISGDLNPAAEPVRTALQSVEGINTVTVRDYEALIWSDLATDRSADIAPAMLGFLQSIERRKRSSCPRVRAKRRTFPTAFAEWDRRSC